MIRKPLNLEAAVALVKVYRSITEDTIKERFPWYYKAITEGNLKIAGRDIMGSLTKFGTTSCGLCGSADALDTSERSNNGTRCNHCIHYLDVELVGDIDPLHFRCMKADTYNAIKYASDIKSLLKALQDHADYLDTIITKIKSNMEK